MVGAGWALDRDGASKLWWGWEIGLGVGGDWAELFTALSGCLSDELLGSGVRALARIVVKMPAGFELEDCDKVGRVNQCLVFGSLSGIETTFVCTRTENFDPRLHRLVDTEGNQTSSRLRVEAEAQRFQKAVERRGRIHGLTLTRPVHVAGEAFTVVWRV
jgi:hypothetical protein